MRHKIKIDKTYKKGSETASVSIVAGMLKQIPAILCSDKFGEFEGGSRTRIRWKENPRFEKD